MLHEIDMKDNLFYVYKLIDPRTNNPFCVGKGKDQQDSSHLQEAHKIS